MTTFKNSSFDIRVKRSRQVTSAYSLRGYITRSILSKFGASEYIEIDGLYAAAIKKIVGEMDVEVSKNNKESWIFIPVRSDQEVIDNALLESYRALTEEKADEEEDVLVEESEVIEETVQKQDELIDAPIVEEQGVEPVAAEPVKVEPVVEDNAQDAIVETVTSVNVEPVVAQEQPVVHTNNNDHRQNGRNNNYSPRNNNNNQNGYKK